MTKQYLTFKGEAAGSDFVFGFCVVERRSEPSKMTSGYLYHSDPLILWLLFDSEQSVAYYTT